jgi:hypothetical protein
MTREKVQRAVLVLGGLVAFLCFLSLCTNRSEQPPEENAPTEQTPSPSEPTPTARPTHTPRPTATLYPEAALRQAILDALGEVNRDEVDTITAFSYNEVTNEVYVRWSINDNFSEQWIKDGARDDIIEIMGAVVDTGLDVSTVEAEGTFPLVDLYGNESEEVVVRVTFTAETLGRVNWEGIPLENIYLVADEQWRHPAFMD